MPKIGNIPWNKGLSTKEMGKSRPVTTKIEKNCIVCNKPFISWKVTETQHCSRSCGGKSSYSKNKIINSKEIQEKARIAKTGVPNFKMRGELHPMWKGGTAIGRRYKHLTGRVEYKQWREAVFKRDNWTCQKCFKRSGEKYLFIEAHHKKAWKDNISERYEITNGVTYCQECHRNEHKRTKTC